MKDRIEGNHPTFKYVTWITFSVEETKFVEAELKKMGYEVEVKRNENIELVEVKDSAMPNVKWVEVDKKTETILGYYSKQFSPNITEVELNSIVERDFRGSDNSIEGY